MAGSKSHRGHQITTLVAVAVCVVAAVAAVVLAQTRQPHTSADIEIDAPNPELLARTAAIACLPYTFSSTSIDDDFRHASAALTGVALKQYTEAMLFVRDRAAADPTLRATCTHDGVAVVDDGVASAETLAFLEVTTTTRTSTTHQKQSATCEMTKVDGVWKISTMTIVS